MINDPVIHRTPWSLPPEAYFQGTEIEYEEHVDMGEKIVHEVDNGRIYPEH